MDWRSRAFLVGGGVLALVAGVIAYVLLARATVVTLTSAVLVAAADIPERTIINSGNVNQLLTLRQVPVEQVPQDALADPKQAIGRATRQRIAAGSVLVDSNLTT